MNPVVMGFADATAHQEQLLETVRETRMDLAHWFARASGVAEGYYLAGAVSNFERDTAVRYLKGLYQNRLAMLELAKQARLEGIA